jgi:broad specificity phosphatase PhoE
MRLLLMRHGESVGNRAGRMAGHGADGLTERGRSQSQHLAQWLSTQWSPTAIYCSPLMRAVETLAQVLVGLGVPAASLEGTGQRSRRLRCPGQRGGRWRSSIGRRSRSFRRAFSRA